MSVAGATTVREALNRGLNFFGTAVLALLATSIIHGFQVAPTCLLGVAAKIAGMRLPYGRLVLAGPDFGIALFLALAAVIFGWQFVAQHEPPGEARTSHSSRETSPAA